MQAIVITVKKGVRPIDLLTDYKSAFPCYLPL